MDLNVIEFVPDCDVFLVGHLVVFFFFGSSCVIDMVIIFLQKVILECFGQVFLQLIKYK